MLKSSTNNSARISLVPQRCWWTNLP